MQLTVGFFYTPTMGETVEFTHLPLGLIRCKLRAKLASKKDRYGEGGYSNRKISTGNNFAAALAGTRVAPTEMNMAASEIHRPSRRFA